MLFCIQHPPTPQTIWIYTELFTPSRQFKWTAHQSISKSEIFLVISSWASESSAPPWPPPPFSCLSLPPWQWQITPLPGRDWKLKAFKVAHAFMLMRNSDMICMPKRLFWELIIAAHHHKHHRCCVFFRRRLSFFSSSPRESQVCKHPRKVPLSHSFVLPCAGNDITASKEGPFVQNLYKAAHHWQAVS